MLKKLTKSDFQRDYLPLFDQLFLPAGHTNWNPFPFRDPEWQTVVANGMQDLSPSVFRALAATAEAMGDRRAILTDAEAEPRHLYPVEFAWNLGSIFLAYREGPMGTDAALFGRSGSWGVYFDWEPCIAYIAGTPHFVEAFLSALGGIDVLKQELKETVDETEDWPMLYDISRALERVGWQKEIMDDKYILRT